MSRCVSDEGPAQPLLAGIGKLEDADQSPEAGRCRDTDEGRQGCFRCQLTEEGYLQEDQEDESRHTAGADAAVLEDFQPLFDDQGRPAKGVKKERRRPIERRQKQADDQADEGKEQDGPAEILIAPDALRSQVDAR